MRFTAIPRQTISHSFSELKILLKIFRGGKVLGGKYISEFEKKFAKYIGKKYSISLHSARLGFFLTLKKIGLKKGDEIIVPAYTFFFMPHIINLLGFKPIFVDLSPGTVTMDPDKVRLAITKKTKGILVTHLLGYPCDIDKILKIAKEKKLYIFEDCAHAFGAEYNHQKVGSFGDISFFSFGMGKNIDCFGGGALVSDNKQLIDKIRKELTRMPFPTHKEIFSVMAYSYISSILLHPIIFTIFLFPCLVFFSFFKKDPTKKMMKEEPRLPLSFPKSKLKRFTNIQGAIGLEHLKHADSRIQARRNNSKILSSIITPEKKITVVRYPKKATPSFLLYEIRHKDKNRLRKNLLIKGIDTRDEYSFIYTDIENGVNKKEKTDFPEARKALNQAIHISTGPELTKSDITFIGNGIRSALNKKVN